MQIPKVHIFGVPFSKMSFRDTVDWLVGRVESRTPTQVITANPIMVMAALERPGWMEIMQRAELIVPDGAGVVWAAGYVGNPVAEKVAGIELMEELIRIGQDREWKVFLLGAAPDVIQAAASRLKEKYPKIRLVGVRDGYFTEKDDAAVIRQIREAGPDLLFVGRSVDTQESWIDRYKQELGVPVTMGVGGSFDVWSGKTTRAPRWMIRLKLEWLHRLIKEPTRYKRMLALPKFAMKVMRERDNVQKPR